ncbi:MAG: hypothetical protein U0228_12675 [Myxococcaceae bacterium]
MLWRSENRVLARRGDSWFLFTFLTAEEIATRRFDDSSYSDEDDLWITTHLVEGDAFKARTRIEGPYADRTPRDEVILTGLAPLDDEPLRERLLRHADDDRARAVALAEKRADARVDRVPGANRPLTLEGAEVARLALVERVRRWSDDRASALLATLLEFDAARPGAAATSAFVRGCLLACFREPPAAVTGPATPHRALAARVAAHAVTLDADADGQERVDALRNASSLSRAADAMRLAATLLS